MPCKAGMLPQPSCNVFSQALRVLPCALQKLQWGRGFAMALEGMTEFREFIVFAKHLNVTHAADELHVSPSTLSRHLSALEQQIGMPLIRRDGASASLTPVGSLVLKKASTLVGEYDSLLEQVEHYRNDASYSLRVAYALDDRTMIDAISLAKLSLKQTYGGFNVQPFHGRGQSGLDALVAGEVDVCIDYNLDEAKLAGRDLVAVPLMQDSIVIALPKGAFPGQGQVHVSQVCRRYIPRPSASFDNYFDRVMGLFAGCDQRPPVRFIDANTMDEFFMHALEADEMWLFSRRQFFDYASSIPLSYRASCEIHELTGCDTGYRRYAVYRASNPNRLVAQFVDELAKTDPEVG